MACCWFRCCLVAEEEEEVRVPLVREAGKKPNLTISPSLVLGDNVTSKVLASEMMDSIKRNLPGRLLSMSLVWRKLYCFEENGVDLESLRDALLLDTELVIVLRTGKGEVVGAYLNIEPLQNNFFLPSRISQRQLNSQSSLSSLISNESTEFTRPKSSSSGLCNSIIPIPTGESFVFSFARTSVSSPPSGNESVDEKIVVYKWKTGTNFLVSNNDCIGIGFKPNFALYINEDITRGSSGPSETFGNDSSLTSEEFFDIVDVEVFALELERGVNVTAKKSPIKLLKHITEEDIRYYPDDGFTVGVSFEEEDDDENVHKPLEF